MWQDALVDHLGQQFQQPLRLASTRRISAGSAEVWSVVTEPHHAVICKKVIAAHHNYLQSEASSLQALAQAHLPVPQQLGLISTRSYSLLAMEQLTTHAATSPLWKAAGQLLAKMHHHQQSYYGAKQDNFIGPNRQPNGEYSQWATFFAEQRIGYQLALAADNHLNFGEPRQIVGAVKDRLAQHQPPASLVHGDLWNGNLLFANNQPYFIDPACYYGDRETDLAMTELFGGFPQTFYQGYQASYPIAASYAQRKPLYQLYHLLNHANLFAGIYIQEAQTLIDELLAA